MVKVKICGITNLQDAQASVDAGADMLGFNFYKKSRRYISPEDSLKIVTMLPSSVEKVGVFVNESVDSVLKITNDVRLDAIQLHGDEDIAYVADISKRTNKTLIKAFRVTQTFDIATVLDWDCDFQLFDTYSRQQYGGTGERFAQDNFLFQIYVWLPCSAYIAGGLTPDNVADAIREAHPYGVDVASGVESSPGKKDPKKLEAFIRNAKNA